MSEVLSRNGDDNIGDCESEEVDDSENFWREDTILHPTNTSFFPEPILDPAFLATLNKNFQVFYMSILSAETSKEMFKALKKLKKKLKKKNGGGKITLLIINDNLNFLYNCLVIYSDDDAIALHNKMQLQISACGFAHNQRIFQHRRECRAWLQDTVYGCLVVLFRLR